MPESPMPEICLRVRFSGPHSFDSYPGAIFLEEMTVEFSGWEFIIPFQNHQFVMDLFIFIMAHFSFLDHFRQNNFAIFNSVGFKE